MNPRQAATLKRLIEDGHPDSVTTVTAQDDGAEIVISGAPRAQGLSGPGGASKVVLRLRDNSPFLLFHLARHGLAGAELPEGRGSR